MPIKRRLLVVLIVIALGGGDLDGSLGRRALRTLGTQDGAPKSQFVIISAGDLVKFPARRFKPIAVGQNLPPDQMA